MGLPLSSYSFLQELIHDSSWRLNHLYWIENKEGELVRFRLNEAQSRLHRELWYRNDILKARQLGISTYVALLILDGCLFTPHYHCGIIDKSLPDAQQKLAKIRLAWHHLDYLPPHPTPQDEALALLGAEIKRRSGVLKRGRLVPAAEAKTHMAFSHESHVHIGTNLRGGTLQLLHISELAHISVRSPARAREIKTGAINTVPPRGIVLKESTHEGGKCGINYELTRQAMENQARVSSLSPLDFRFFFFSWHDNPEYSLEGEGRPLEEGMKTYFGELEQHHGIFLREGQKQWYATMSKTMHSHMKQEYPSTPHEAFLSAHHDTIYGAQISALRSQGKLGGEFEWDRNLPLYTSWDIGMSDHTVLWLVQAQGNSLLWLDSYANSQKTLSSYVEKVKAWEKQWGRIHTHFLPHDAGRRDPLGKSYEAHLRAEGVHNTRIVPRTSDIWQGINMLRCLLEKSFFHAATLKSPQDEVTGISLPSALEHLELYTTQPPGAQGALKEMPLHNAHSHTADAARMFAEACSHGLVQEMKGDSGRGLQGAQAPFSRSKKQALMSPPSYGFSGE